MESRRHYIAAPMPAKDLGTKHVCFKCGAKFYDLRKPDPICPKCGADQREASAKPEGRRNRLSAVPKIIEPIDPVEKDELDDVEDVEDEEPEDEDEV